ncbi:hypothetical protein GCM10009815_24680 [Nocardioides marmoribigeumensis]
MRGRTRVGAGGGPPGREGGGAEAEGEGGETDVHGTSQVVEPFDRRTGPAPLPGAEVPGRHWNRFSFSA